MDQIVQNPRTEPDLDLERLLHYRIQRLASKMSLLTSREVLAGSGVHIGEWRLICLLREYGDVNHTTISQRLALDPGRTSKLLKAAERKGLVYRKRDPDDGRASLFGLTDAGNETWAALWPSASAVADAFHDQFETEELKQLNSLLDRAIAYANTRV